VAGWEIPDPERVEEAAGVSTAVASCGYRIRDIICYFIRCRIHYSPSAATHTDMAAQLGLGEEEETKTCNQDCPESRRVKWTAVPAITKRTAGETRSEKMQRI
jgi:hypothetical protein